MSDYNPIENAIDAAIQRRIDEMSEKQLTQGERYWALVEALDEDRVVPVTLLADHLDEPERCFRLAGWCDEIGPTLVSAKDRKFTT